MKEIALRFKDIWTEDDKYYIETYSGVYCVYTGTYNKRTGKKTLNELIYVGQAENINERIANHDRLDDWLSYLTDGETLFYTCAHVTGEDKDRAEAALIYKLKPWFNDKLKHKFDYPDTKLSITGAWRGRLPSTIVLVKHKTETELLLFPSADEKFIFESA